jgi:hypothetical protein
MITSVICKVRIYGLEPNAGPLSGNTRVLVRGGPFTGMETSFPNPKCKFGRDDLIVEATYVKCTIEPTKLANNEANTTSKTSTCLQCENAPAG